MAGKNGTHNDPTFETRSGVRLRLKKVAPFLLNYWDEDYRAQHPEPLPPTIRLENGDDWRNPKDEWFLTLQSRWIREYNMRSTEFVLEFGVETDPPAGWQPPIAFPGKSNKILWLLTGDVVLPDEVDALIAAITSLTVPTEEAIEAAQKN